MRTHLFRMQLAGLSVLGAVFGIASAAPVRYTVDPSHTYPSFEADHHGGLSMFRGKFNKSSGTVTLDREAKTGNVDITVDADSIDFGHDKLNAHAKSDAMFDVAQFPVALYKGNVVFNGDAPAAVDGFLTLHGVTKPVKLTINSFQCQPDALTKGERCGADAIGTFNRADFGITFGKGFKMDVALRIQIESTRDQTVPAAAMAQ